MKMTRPRPNVVASSEEAKVQRRSYNNLISCTIIQLVLAFRSFGRAGMSPKKVFCTVVLVELNARGLEPRARRFFARLIMGGFSGVQFGRQNAFCEVVVSEPNGRALKPSARRLVLPGDMHKCCVVMEVELVSVWCGKSQKCKGAMTAVGIKYSCYSGPQISNVRMNCVACDRSSKGQCHHCQKCVCQKHGSARDSSCGLSWCIKIC